MPSQVKIQVPEGMGTDEVIKSLELAVAKLKKSHDHEDAVLPDENEAASHLAAFVNDSFDLMMSSMTNEIAEVLAGGRDE